MSGRKIIHFDMDCFYAAVEEKYQPNLRGKPVGVGGSIDGRGVLTTANYEARKFGVRSAMTARRALTLCPQIILVRPDFAKYKLESRRVHEILERYSSKIEPLSLDEAYVDVTDSPFEQGSATRIAERVRREVKGELGLTVSAGVAPNKFLAKIASDLKKPDGLAVIRPEQIETFMKTLPIEKIWGVGKVTAAKMQRMGFKTCGDLQELPLARLIDLFGSWGAKLYDYSRGIDNREVSRDRDRKSLSVEETYMTNLVNRNDIRHELRVIYNDFTERLAVFRGRGEEEQHKLARSAVVKLKFSDFRVKGREKQWVGVETPPFEVFAELLEQALDGETLPIRLLGLGVRFNSKPSSLRPEGGALQLGF